MRPASHGGIGFVTKGGERHDVEVYALFDNFKFPAPDRVRFD